MNKPGGGHAIAMAYLNQRPGDAHYLSMALTNLITNRIVGSHPLTYTDVTPLALLTSEYIGMSVRTDSPVKDGRDLIARLRADPEALSFAITNRAGGNHIAAGTVLKAARVDLRKVKFVPSRDPRETPRRLGGHSTCMSTALSSWKHVHRKAAHAGGVSPKRLGGDVAGVPKWKSRDTTPYLQLGARCVAKGLSRDGRHGPYVPALVTLDGACDTENQWTRDMTAKHAQSFRKRPRHLEELLTELGEREEVVP